MPIIPYPRIGQRLAPSLLRELLAEPVTTQFKTKLPLLQQLKLCDLDETVWTRFESDVCFGLADAVIRCTARKWPFISWKYGNRTLLKASFDFTLDLLPLEVRTFNCLDFLRGENPLVCADDWARLTLDELVELHSFGAKSLVDFLCSYESLVFCKDSAFAHQFLDGIDSVLRNWIKGEPSDVPPEYLPLRIPTVPTGVKLDDLGLRHRTHRILEEQGYAKKLELLSARTLKELMDLSGFGITCLKDLLSALFRLPAARDGQDPSTSFGVEAALPNELDERASLFRRWLDNPVFPLPRSLLHSNLPDPPSGATANSLSLQNRTANCLLKHGYADRLAALTELTIEDLFELRGFGDECFKDLLTAWLRDPEKQDLPIVSSPPTTIEEELRLLLAQVLPKGNPRNVDIVVQYLGLDGKESEGLRQVGERYGISKERVRQICNRAEHGITKRNPQTPILDKALELVTRQTPRLSTAIEDELRSEGFSASPFRLEGLIQAARIVGRSVPFSIEEIGHSRFVVLHDNLPVLQTYMGFIQEAMRTRGVATIEDVTVRLQESMDPNLDQKFALDLILKLPGFSWLDKPSGWFWIKDAGWNRLANPIRKVLSVAGQVEVAALREGIARPHRTQGSAPPRRVLLELCRQMPGFRVENTMVIADPPIDWQVELGGVERTMARILKEHGPVLARARFEEFCVNEQMKRATFYVYLGYSPIIEWLAPGVYSLRGAEFPPGMVEALRLPRKRDTAVRIDHGWMADGRIWIAYRLSQAMLTSGMCSVPSGFKQYLQGSFPLMLSDQTQIGQFTVGQNAAWGLSPLFRRYGGEPNDILLLQVDLAGRRVSASIGGEELIFTVSSTESLPAE